MLHLVGNQAYKLKMSEKCRIHNIFHVSLLEKNTIRNKYVNDKQLNFKIKADNNKKYKVENIYNSTVFIKKLIKGQLLGLYYLVL